LGVEDYFFFTYKATSQGIRRGRRSKGRGRGSFPGHLKGRRKGRPHCLKRATTLGGEKRKWKEKQRKEGKI